MRKGDWIPINYYTPNDGDSVLMLSTYRTKNGGVRWSIEEHVYFEDLGFRAHEVESVEEKITHWMPIELPDGYEDLH